MAAIILWSVVSRIFFIANRSATKPLIACPLPIVCIVSHPDFVAFLRAVMGFSPEVWTHIKRCKFQVLEKDPLMQHLRQILFALCLA